MSDVLGWVKVVLLLVVVMVWSFAAVQVGNAEKDLKEIRKQLEGQGQVIQEINVSQKQLQEQLKRLNKNIKNGVVITSDKNTDSLDPNAWVPDGLIKDHGKNCLLSGESIAELNPGAREGEQLNMVFEADFNYMNMLLEHSGDLSTIAENVWTGGLYGRQFKEDGRKWYGILAKSLVVTDDYKTYTMKLRDDFYWHLPAVDLNNPKYKWLRDKGRQKVTAHDFEFTIMKLVKNLDTECDVTRGYYEKLESVKALDDHTLQVKWKEKTNSSMEWSSISTCLPEYIYSCYENGKKIPDIVLGAEFNKHWFNDNLIGYGPYRFVKYEKGKKIVLERDDSFPMRQPRFKKVVYQFIDNPDQQMARFLRGEVDFIAMRSGQYSSYIHALIGDEKAQKKSLFTFEEAKGPNDQFLWAKIKYPGFSYIGWNQDKAMFKDKRVRKAMTLALPAKELLENVWMKLGFLSSGPLLHGSPDYDSSIAPLPFDLKQAASLLDEAGWVDKDGDGIREKMIDGKKIDLKFQVVHYSPLPEYDQMFAIYSKKLRTIGVSCKGRGLKWPSLMKASEEKNFDAIAMAWGLSYTTDPYQIWHSSQADNPKGSNRIDFKMKEVDDIIEKARTLFDPNKRSKLFHRWHRIFHEEQPYTIWRASQRVFAWNKRLNPIRFGGRRPVYDITEWSLAK